MKRLGFYKLSIVLFLLCCHFTAFAEPNNSKNRNLFGGEEEDTNSGCRRRRSLFRSLFGGDDTGSDTEDNCDCRRRRSLFGGDDEGGDECREDDDYPHEGDWDKYDWEAPHDISAVSALLSMIGSAWILLEILVDKKKRKKVYHRILFALSLFDFMASTCFFLTPLVIINGEWLGYTSTSCEIAGFFTYWSSLCIPMYNTALATYFYLSVKGGWQEDRIHKRFERHAHFVIPLFGLVLAIAAFPLDMYNLYNNFCFAVLGPDRGTFTLNYFFLGLFWALVLFCGLLTCVLMFLLYRHVRGILRQSSQYNFSTPKSEEERDFTPQDERLLTRVRNMALLYTIPFTTTWVCSVILMIIQQEGFNNRMYVSPLTGYFISIWIALFLPLQGFFNWIIYMIPRFQRIKKENSSEQFFVVVLRVFGGISRRRNVSNGRADSADDDDDDDDESMMGSMWAKDESSSRQAKKSSEASSGSQNSKTEHLESEEIFSA